MASNAYTDEITAKAHLEISQDLARRLARKLLSLQINPDLRQQVAMGSAALAAAGVWDEPQDISPTLYAWALVELIREADGVFPPELELEALTDGQRFFTDLLEAENGQRRF